MNVEAPSTERPEALQVLLEAASLLLKATSESESLTQILGLASSLLGADAYAVWREFDETHTWRIVAKRGLSDRYRTETPAAGGAPSSVWAIEDTLTDPRLRYARGAYNDEGIRSMLVVPWMLGTTISGTIVFYWRTQRTFTPDDEAYACALSNMSAAALNRLELQEQSAREKRRLAFLAEASAVLASSLDYEATLQRVAQLAVPGIADWCTVHIVEDGVVSRLVVAHADPTKKSFIEEFSRLYPEVILPDHGLGKVLATGEPEFYPRITDEMLVQAAKDEQHLAMIRQVAFNSSILVPLVSRGKVLGAIRLLAGGDGRFYGEDDVQLAQDLARRAAVAIENARLHRAVLEQQHELRLSHAAAHMGSWSLDLRDQTAVWSDEFKALHGVEPDVQPTLVQALGMVHEEDRARVQSELDRVIQSEEVQFSYEHRTVTADGRIIWLQNRGRVKRDGNGKALQVSGLSIDITESRLAEQALRRTEKLAAAGRLAATVAHEVNNPLEALVNLIYLAQGADGLPEDAANHLRIADGELRRMAHIVRQTLGFYRESTIAHDVDLGRLVAEVMDLYRSRAMTRGLTLMQEDHEPGLKVCVNGGEIKQVVANLVSNAIDATPAGGRVTASVRRVGHGLEIVVADTGSGISEQSRKHLFEPFFTTKSDVGTGLGLWVSKGIVEKHGGTIAVDPAGAVGTVVRFSLPMDGDSA